MNIEGTPTSESLEFYTSFIRSCLVSHWNPGSIEHLRRSIVTESFDWEVCLQMMVSTATAPLVLSLLSGKGILPQEIENKIRTIQQQVRVYNVILYIETNVCLKEFKNIGIPVLLLKGLALVKMVYDDYSLRPCVDADILVRKKDLNRAVNMLLEMGYEINSPIIHGEAGLNFENEILLVKQDPTRARVDLHWNLFDSPYYQESLPVDWFWKTAQKVDFYGLETSILCPEAQVLHLCGHIILHHQGDELLWLNDIARMIAKDPDHFDWDILIEKAQSFQLMLPLQKVLAELSQNWSLPIPAESSRRISELRATKDEVNIYNRLVDHKRESGQRFFDDLSGMRSWNSRLRFAILNIFPSREYMRQRYCISHSILLPLYYPYRWIIGLRSLF